jgi:hypothetical protein
MNHRRKRRDDREPGCAHEARQFLQDGKLAGKIVAVNSWKIKIERILIRSLLKRVSTRPFAAGIRGLRPVWKRMKAGEIDKHRHAGGLGLRGELLRKFGIDLEKGLFARISIVVDGCEIQKAIRTRSNFRQVVITGKADLRV